MHIGALDAWSDSPISRREQTIEVGVFLFLIVPSMAFSLFAVRQGTIGFVLTAVFTILRDVALVSLILFFLWRNRESVKGIGWIKRHGFREAVVGVLLFVPMYYAAQLLDQLLVAAGFSSPSTPLPSLEATGGVLQSILGLLLVAVVAVSEETIFRGYLLLRFGNVFESPLLAVCLSALIFSLGHGYEGTAGIVTVGFMGVVFAVVYLWRGSLVAPIVMHFLQDFLLIVLAPWLGIR